jgi:hypothetical protein
VLRDGSGSFDDFALRFHEIFLRFWSQVKDKEKQSKAYRRELAIAEFQKVVAER